MKQTILALVIIIAVGFTFTSCKKDKKEEVKVEDVKTEVEKEILIRHHWIKLIRGDQVLISSFRFPFLRNCKLTLLVSPTNIQMKRISRCIPNGNREMSEDAVLIEYPVQKRSEKV